MVCESVKKINNHDHVVNSIIRNQCGVGSIGCSWGRHAYLKSSVIADLNEMVNTVNMVSVLQGEDPPPLVNTGNHI